MSIRNFLAVFSVLVLLAGCSGKTVVESDLGLDDAPDWVNEGSQALNDRDGRLFHGVGQAPNMGDPSLQISVADNRARAEIARVVSTYVDYAANDYLASSAVDNDRETAQSVSQQLKNSTRANLSGARIIAHWKDEKSKIVYSLAELDMKQIKKTVAAAEDMNESVKRYLDTNADNIFDRLAQEKK